MVKITSFRGLFDALFQGEPPDPGARNFVAKTRDLAAAHSEDVVILARVADVVADDKCDWNLTWSCVIKLFLV